MQEQQPTGMSRRRFFGAFGGVSTAAVATVTMLRPGEVQAYDPGEEEAGPRYQETDHVKAFYRVNGYPAAKE